MAVVETLRFAVSDWANALQVICPYYSVCRSSGVQHHSQQQRYEPWKWRDIRRTCLLDLLALLARLERD